MLLAAVRDDAYNVVLVLHIVAVVVAFAPAAINPVTEARIRREEGEEGVARHYRYAVRGSRQVHFPALLLAGLFGGALIGMSKTNDQLVWEFEQTWIWLGITTWVAMGGVVWAMIIPAERKLAAGDASAAPALARAGGIVTLLVIAQLYLMVFKPGA